MSTKRKKSKHLKMGHPARAETRRRAHTRFSQPDATEKHIQELNRLMRAEIARAPEEDGAITGPLTVAAKHIAPQIAKLHDLTPLDEHTVAIERWLIGVWGDQIHNFDPEQYLRWRADCRERALRTKTT